MKPLKYILLLTLLPILVASNLIVIAGASEATAPSVPEFTVKYVDASYDVPTTHSIDPYMGNLTYSGYHVQNRTIEVSIKNQPFTAYQSDGRLINYYLNIRTKGSYDNNWLTVYSIDNGYLTQSNSSYTTVAFSLDDNNFPFWDNVHGGATVDFQVQTQIGSIYQVANGSATNPFSQYPWIFDGQASNWSNTQTITIPKDAMSTQPTSTPTATETQGYSSTPNAVAGNLQVNDLVIVVIAALAVIIVAVIAIAAVLIKRAKTKTATPPPN
jgi:hypothetical protein